ncbi:unnamed protein product [Boreogadus saida]
MSPVNPKYPQPGDLIEIVCGLIKHWAVYVGDGFVVHLTTTNGSGATSSSSSGSSSGATLITKGLVKYEELKAVVGDAKWKINNLMGGRRRPRDAEIIVAEALRLVGSEPQYNLFLNNCEHFATGLRYGISLSKQDKHCLLELSLANVQGLLKQGVYPIVIHIQPKNKKYGRLKKWFPQCGEEKLIEDLCRREKLQLETLPLFHHTLEPSRWRLEQHGRPAVRHPQCHRQPTEGGSLGGI